MLINNCWFNNWKIKKTCQDLTWVWTKDWNCSVYNAPLKLPRTFWDIRSLSFHMYFFISVLHWKGWMINVVHTSLLHYKTVQKYFQVLLRILPKCSNRKKQMVCLWWSVYLIPWGRFIHDMVYPTGQQTSHRQQSTRCLMGWAKLRVY